MKTKLGKAFEAGQAIQYLLTAEDRKKATLENINDTPAEIAAAVYGRWLLAVQLHRCASVQPGRWLPMEMGGEEMNIASLAPPWLGVQRNSNSLLVLAISRCAGCVHYYYQCGGKHYVGCPVHEFCKSLMTADQKRGGDPQAEDVDLQLAYDTVVKYAKKQRLSVKEIPRPNDAAC